MLLTNSFLLPHQFCNFEFNWFHNTEQSSEIWILKIKMLFEFQNKTNVEIIEFYLMHFGFSLDWSDIDLWNIDLLDTDISSKHFVCLHDILKTSSRYVFKTLWRRLQLNNFSSSKTSWRRVQDVLEDEKLLRLEDVLRTSSRRLWKTSSRRLGRWKIVTLKTCWRRLQDMSWKRLQDVFKTNKYLLGSILYSLFTWCLHFS